MPDVEHDQFVVRPVDCVEDQSIESVECRNGERQANLSPGRYEGKREGPTGFAQLPQQKSLTASDRYREETEQPHEAHDARLPYISFSASSELEYRRDLIVAREPSLPLLSETALDPRPLVIGEPIDSDVAFLDLFNEIRKLVLSLLGPGLDPFNKCRQLFFRHSNSPQSALGSRRMVNSICPSASSRQLSTSVI